MELFNLTFLSALVIFAVASMKGAASEVKISLIKRSGPNEGIEKYVKEGKSAYADLKAVSTVNLQGTAAQKRLCGVKQMCLAGFRSSMEGLGDALMKSSDSHHQALVRQVMEEHGMSHGNGAGGSSSALTSGPRRSARLSAKGKQ